MAKIVIEYAVGASECIAIGDNKSPLATFKISITFCDENSISQWPFCRIFFASTFVQTSNKHVWGLSLL
jgi:hypothetical protein